VELLAMKSKEEHRALLNAVRKLGELGERLGPPHIKPLKGAAALLELRPRQGQSDWRAIYCRVGDFYAILAIDRHTNFGSLIDRAQIRAEQYNPLLKVDKP
jgi:Phage derived protein Gp49-like (DUF891)